MVTPISLLHWHIEVSSICTLKCPRCARAEVPETLLNSQLTLKFFQEQIGEETIKTVQKISFCGDDGDPIYAKDFLLICGWLKMVNPKIHLVIITNGSYKKKSWWMDLSRILNEYDEIHWSLDGWDQASNEQYRVNCNWESIVLGIGTFKGYNSSTYTTIATIIFKFNEDYLHYIRQVAEYYSIDCWAVTRSTKFGRVYPQQYGHYDELQPRPENISPTLRYDRTHHWLSGKLRPTEGMSAGYLAKRDEILAGGGKTALCYVGTKGVYLKANGEMYPCCWTANRYPHNKDIIAVAESRFNLNHRTLQEVLADEWWSTDFLKFDNLDCRTKCTQENFTKEFVTEW